MGFSHTADALDHLLHHILLVKGGFISPVCVPLAAVRYAAEVGQQYQYECH